MDGALQKKGLVTLFLLVEDKQIIETADKQSPLAILLLWVPL